MPDNQITPYLLKLTHPFDKRILSYKQSSASVFLPFDDQ